MLYFCFRSSHITRHVWHKEAMQYLVKIMYIINLFYGFVLIIVEKRRKTFCKNHNPTESWSKSNCSHDELFLEVSTISVQSSPQHIIIYFHNVMKLARWHKCTDNITNIIIGLLMARWHKCADNITNIITGLLMARWHNGKILTTLCVLDLGLKANSYA